MMFLASAFMLTAAGCWKTHPQGPSIEPAEAAGEKSEAAARVKGLTGDVKVKRADGVEWISAAAGLELNDQDRIQTGGRSSAEITVGKSDRIR